MIPIYSMRIDKKLLFHELISLSLVVLFFVLALFSLYVSAASHILMPWWFANVCGIYLLLRYQTKAWLWPIFLVSIAGLFAYMGVGDNPSDASRFTVMNGVEIFLSAFWIRYFSLDTEYDKKIRSALLLLVLMLVIAPLVRTMLGSALFSWKIFSTPWLNCFVADSFCMTTLLPITLCLNHKNLQKLTIEQGCALSLGMLLVSTMIFYTWLSLSGGDVLLVIALIIFAMFNSILSTFILISFSLFLIIYTAESKAFSLLLSFQYPYLKIYLSNLLIFTVPYLIAVYGSMLRSTLESLNYYKTHDYASGLLNRKEFEKLLLDAQEESYRTGKQYILGYLDIDHLQMFNMVTGYSGGDDLLQRVAKLLRRELSENCILARLGGDEFGILASNVSAKLFKKKAQELVVEMNAMRFNWHNRTYQISAGLGLSLINKKTQSVDQLLNEAEFACGLAKTTSGANHVVMLDSRQNIFIEKHHAILLAHDINEAIDNNKLLLYVQKILPIRHPEEGDSYEVLLRMLDENNQLVLASGIIPVAERYNLITKLDRWVVSEFLSQYDQSVSQAKSASFSINISAISLSNPVFLKFLKSSIKNSTLSPHQICFEITETAMMKKLDKTKKFIQEITDFGCKIALDDFGVGFGYFSYLQNFKVDYIKIDGSFVMQANLSHIDLVIVQSINDMAHQLKIQTIAECVQNDLTLAVMKKIGVDYIQGFAIDKPKPISEIFQAH